MVKKAYVGMKSSDDSDENSEEEREPGVALIPTILVSGMAEENVAPEATEEPKKEPEPEPEPEPKLETENVCCGDRMGVLKETWNKGRESFPIYRCRHCGTRKVAGTAI